jgi:hypothetical protein
MSLVDLQIHVENFMSSTVLRIKPESEAHLHYDKTYRFLRLQLPRTSTLRVFT